VVSDCKRIDVNTKKLQDARRQVETVLARKRDLEKTHKTIFEKLRDSALPPQEKPIERLTDEGFIHVGSGGETTAQTLAVLSFHLLNNPPVLKKLQAELDQDDRYIAAA